MATEPSYSTRLASSCLNVEPRHLELEFDPVCRPSRAQSPNRAQANESNRGRELGSHESTVRVSRQHSSGSRQAHFFLKDKKRKEAHSFKHTSHSTDKNQHLPPNSKSTKAPNIQSHHMKPNKIKIKNQRNHGPVLGDWETQEEGSRRQRAWLSASISQPSVTAPRIGGRW